jgi:hypothetical protein
MVFLARDARDHLANALQGHALSGVDINRAKNVFMQDMTFKMARKSPENVKKLVVLKRAGR